MASLDFPSNPTDQQTYSLNGITYQYNAAIGAWLTVVVGSQPVTLAANTQVLYSNNGLISGSSGLVFNNSANTLYANTINVSSNMRVYGNLQVGTGTVTITNDSISAASITVAGSAIPSGIVANLSFDTANAAYNGSNANFVVSNAAFSKANAAFANSSGTFVGELTIKGNTSITNSLLVTGVPVVKYGSVYETSTNWNTIIPTNQYTWRLDEIYNGTAWTNGPGSAAYSYGGLMQWYGQSHALQLYIPHTASLDNGMWFRTAWGPSTTWANGYTWKRIYDSGNCQVFTPIKDSNPSASAWTGSITLSTKSKCMFIYGAASYLGGSGTFTITLSIDGIGNIGTARRFTNEGSSHKVAGPGSAIYTLNAGTYTIRLTTNGSSNADDYGHCAVIAFPEV